MWTPHLSLPDGFLQMIHELPPDLRAMAISLLRVVKLNQPELIPLNLLTLWEPRMQAGPLGLFRLSHAWTVSHPDAPMGLLHIVFAAFNLNWRRKAISYLEPVERVGSLALDALLGQLNNQRGNQIWVTEVISLVLSKIMGLELSPWLFASMHQKRFVDMEQWAKERAWIVLRLPYGIEW